ncbi:MAG TPA: patatin-like phospholipase family protein [Gemmatimonadaceae bacterium]|nr:patatin-like phospholipase family protein [Gemmatimonadaceae bacterium]
MSRDLRLAFAMGGGASLGTFSGAALSEVLKLVLLRGVDADGVPYDRVVVDVFSGASAGAMALAVMLRALVHRTPEQERDALDRLRVQCGDELNALAAPRLRELVAAQVVQDLQERVWTREISIARLLGHAPTGDRTLRYAGGIVDRGAVEEIARDVIGFPDRATLDERLLLADRVLYACTLANVTAILVDARTDLNDVYQDVRGNEPGLLGFTDGLTSRTHRELRVFDLNFARVGVRKTRQRDVYPARWCRYHDAPEDEGRIGALSARHTWAKIAATAVAAGAFPFAFEPVVLTRHDYEYGDELWPRELRTAGVTEFPFTYIDGGAFNNEPVREAFRLAAFIDAAPAERPFDRRIIFVDPNFGPDDVDEDPLATDFAVPVHVRFALRDPDIFGSLDGFDLVRRSTLDRLIPHVGSVLGAVLDEATVVEADKVFLVRKRFALRDRIRTFIAATLGTTADAALFKQLSQFCDEQLARQSTEDAIPPGPITLEQELERVIAEEARADAKSPLAPLAGKADAFLDRADRSADPHARAWMLALLFVAVDLIMELEGKHEHSRLVAIAPVLGVKDARTARRVKLPGGRVNGFGGFMSPVPNAHEIRLARHCAREMLEMCGLVREGARAEPTPDEFLSTEQERAYQKDLELGMQAVAARVGALVREGTLLDRIPGVQGIVKSLLAGYVEKMVKQLAVPQVPRHRFELRVRVPDKHFELDGKGFGDRDVGPVRVDDEGAWHLVTYANWERDGAPGTKRRWHGPLLDAEHQRIPIDHDGAVPGFDRRFCTLALPDAKLVAQAMRLPNPIFLATLTPQDRGNALAADRWSLLPGVTPLETTIFGDTE